ncbi:hypothetical protein EYS14_07130 [Alteromonadaceae bacterium M269]|nr:hypothetical protein EYS14_07130 [Alteromonadaceae bacterium M269]
MVRAFKKVNRFLLFITASLFITIGQANAGLIPTGVGNVLLDIDTSGAEPSLLGARNIDVFGTGELYDVSFVNGLFLDIFVDESGLDATDEATATAFARSLLDFVLIDLPVGNFDSLPRLTFGCEFECRLTIPFSFRLFNPNAPFLGNVVDTLSAFNDRLEGGDSTTGIGFAFSGFGTTFSDGEVFADFSLSSTAPTQDVPEPPTLAFMMLILVYLVWNNYKRT